MMTHTGIHLPSKLTFVESEGHYSTYQDEDGNEVYLAHGTGRRLKNFDDLLADLAELWTVFTRTYNRWQHDEFRKQLRNLTIEPEYVDDIKFCVNCNDPGHEEDMHLTGNDGEACNTCFHSYFTTCDSCDEAYSSTNWTLHETRVCDHCLGNGFSHCDDCGGYYLDEYSSEHDHSDGDGCCVSPALSFTVRNDGEEPLANDTQAMVRLPAGVISDEGIGDIARYLRNTAIHLDDEEEQTKFHTLSWQLSQLGEMWQTKDGNYTKRLSRLAYKSFALKLAPSVVSQVGCIARDHSTAVDFEIEVTRDLNQSPEEFAHDDSCWWTDFASSRCALKTNGGFALRTFTEGGWGRYVQGRAWVMPLRQSYPPSGSVLKPTFDTVSPDAFVVFNGYGDLEGYTAARIVSHMAGWTYRKISFSCPPMYVNNDSGYLVAPEEIATDYTDGSLHLSTNSHSELFTTERELTNA